MTPTIIHLINLVGVFMASFFLMRYLIAAMSRRTGGLTPQEASGFSKIAILFAVGVMLMFV